MGRERCRPSHAGCAKGDANQDLAYRLQDNVQSRTGFMASRMTSNEDSTRFWTMDGSGQAHAQDGCVGNGHAGILPGSE